jgi:hypothetical protein
VTKETAEKVFQSLHCIQFFARFQAASMKLLSFGSQFSAESDSEMAKKLSINFAVQEIRV